MLERTGTPEAGASQGPPSPRRTSNANRACVASATKGRPQTGVGGTGDAVSCLLAFSIVLGAAALVCLAPAGDPHPVDRGAASRLSVSAGKSAGTRWIDSGRGPASESLPSRRRTAASGSGGTGRRDP